MRKQINTLREKINDTYRTESALFVVSVIFRVSILIFFIWWGSVVGDFDGRSRTIFPSVGGDSADYTIVTHNILSHGVFSSDQDETRLLPASFRTPGYPLFLVPFAIIGDGYYDAALMQIILSSASVVLMYILARRFLSRRIASVAAWLFVFEPVSAYYANIVLSDTLYVFLQLSALVILFQNKRRLTAPDGLLGGALIGFAILVRPIGQFLPIPIAVGLYLLYRTKGKRLLQTITLFLIGVLLVVSPWMIRNYRIFHTPALSSVPAVSFVSYFAPLYYAHKTGDTFENAQHLFNSRVQENYHDLSFRSLGNVGKMNESVFRYIKEDTFGFARYYLIKTIPFYVTDGIRNVGYTTRLIQSDGTPPNYSDYLLSGDWQGLFRALRHVTTPVALLIVGSGFWSLVLFALCVGFIWGMIVERNQTRLFILSSFLLVLYYAVLTGPVAEARYRMPAEPFMFILAVYGALQIYAKINKNNETTLHYAKG